MRPGRARQQTGKAFGVADVILKPRLLATLVISVLLCGCGAEGRVTSARFEDAATGIQLEYTLTGAHAFLAEFARTLRVRFADREEDFPLEMDTGGYLLMNVYRLPDQTLLLYDGERFVAVDARRETVKQLMSRPETRMAEYVGCFDWPEGETLEFIPPAKRAEKRPVERDAPVPATSSR